MQAEIQTEVPGRNVHTCIYHQAFLGTALKASIVASHPYKLHGFIIEMHLSIIFSDILINYNETGKEVNFVSLLLLKVLPCKHSWTGNYRSVMDNPTDIILKQPS